MFLWVGYADGWRNEDLERINMDELTTKRLAVIKQLYLHGIEQSYEVEPMNGFSILSFHDSVEMFMKLCAETLVSTKIWTIKN